MTKVPFNKPYMTGKELEYIADAYSMGKLSGNGKYTKLCHAWLQNQTTAHKVLLSHSCTSALEMASILCDLQPGDEVIIPTLSFIATANAVSHCGAHVFFVDSEESTLGMSAESLRVALAGFSRSGSSLVNPSTGRRIAAIAPMNAS